MGRMSETPETAQNSPPNARAGRSDKLLHQATFLAAYAKLGSITQAAKAAEVDRRRHSEWMQDPDYERQFHEAHAGAVQSLVDAAYERAVGLNGNKPSDRLMIKFLESIPPGMLPVGWEFNAVRRHELSGPGGTPIEAAMSARELLKNRIASLAAEARGPNDTVTD
jgi:hypothetical protein